jgi:DNA mismatch repair ATPase MutS
MGLNIVLAYAGGPVCAKSARIAQMQICTSISVGDSLLSGRSKFFVETERLSVAIQRAREGKPVIFLVDEILSGTNSVDRAIVASAFLEEMLAGDTVGALTTHDLSLTKIATEEGSRGLLVHMESNDPDDPLHFDYKVKAGISAQSSAIAIAKMMGIEGVSKKAR